MKIYRSKITIYNFFVDESHLVKEKVNRYLTHLEYPYDPIAEFTFTKDKSDFLLPVCESLFLHIKEICKQK